MAPKYILGLSAYIPNFSSVALKTTQILINLLVPIIATFKYSVMMGLSIRLYRDLKH